MELPAPFIGSEKKQGLSERGPYWPTEWYMRVERMGHPRPRIQLLPEREDIETKGRPTERTLK